MGKVISFDGVVLAGGRSSRMGVNKAKLELAGESLCTRAQRVLALTGAIDIWISDNSQPTINHRILRDIFPHAGPLGGIYTALTQSERPLLIIPVDMPSLDESLLTHLVEVNNASCHDAVYFAGTPLPVLIKNTGKAKRFLHHTLTSASSNRSIRHLLKQLSVNSLSVNQPDKLINVNTPAEWLWFTQSHIPSLYHDKVNYDLGHKRICPA